MKCLWFIGSCVECEPPTSRLPSYFFYIFTEVKIMTDELSEMDEVNHILKNERSK